MIRIFIGCAANHEDAESQAVLEYTLRKHSSRPLSIVWMKLSRDPRSPFYSSGREGWQTRLWATPFSGFRWAVPALCGFEGRGIYLDSDFILRADIAELWDQAIAPAAVLAKGGGSWRYCASLWNCARARDLVPPLDRLRGDPGGHREMTSRLRAAPDATRAFVGNWNCVDGENYRDLADPEIKAIHYSSMRHQPHLKAAAARLARQGRRHWFEGRPVLHRRADLRRLFADLLAEATAAGYPPARYETGPLFGRYEKRRAA